MHCVVRYEPAQRMRCIPPSLSQTESIPLHGKVARPKEAQPSRAAETFVMGLTHSIVLLTYQSRLIRCETHKLNTSWLFGGHALWPCKMPHGL